MKASDLGELAVRNLREAVLRNSLTTLGVAVGVASLVAMVSLGVGLQELATKKLANSGLFDTVLVTSRRNIRDFGRSAAKNSGPAAPLRALDDEARHEMERLPNVVEVYPQIRFPTEVRYAGNPFQTVVAGIPFSARGNGAFEGVQGAFFSGPGADEAVLQIEFAKDLSDRPSALIGKDLVVRYMERQALPAQSGSTDPANAGLAAQSGATNSADALGEGFSIVPREKILRIVGIVETEPATGFGGFGNGRLFIPLEVASALRAAQVNDLREAVRASSDKPTYASLTVR